MPLALSIEPSDFVVPPGPVIIFVKVDREAFRHLDPSMNPLTDADSSSAVKRKGKAAVEQVRRDLSAKLFGADVPHSDIQNIYPHPDVHVTVDSDPLIRTKYIGFHWKRDVPAGELSPAVVELTSKSEPVDNCLRFHAMEVVEEDGKAGLVGSIFQAEALRAKMEAEQAQAAQAAIK
ncbi:hypothetical protein C8A03DRAFT_29727 [Achaetomium macrosporum]|uniref:Uncharacterized protein n=1 Tax=Achaetomium macrosporum TaxID=79813 RepID=A0AAN7CIW7_9PEZI|nr:hypothetical protein C8A03DRAFT_29727 [Achaetomium macrosporum]